MTEQTEQTQIVRHYLELDRPEDALGLLAKLLAEDPDAVELHELRASALLAAERPGEAANAAQAGLAIDPDSIVLLDVLALANLDRGRLGEAEEALLSALRLLPESPLLLAHYALVLAEGGVEEKARSTLARAQAIAPDDLAVLRVQVALDYIFGRDGDATRRGRELLAEAPEDPFAHTILGNVASSRGSTHAARRHFDDVARHDFTDHESAAVALEARALAHPLLLPLWPLYRLGVVKFWLVGVGGIFLLGAVAPTPVFLAWLVAYMFLVAYSWIAPPLIRRWVFRGR